MVKPLPLFLSAALLAAPFAGFAQDDARSRLTGSKIDETKLHRLAGNTRSQANSQNDRGRVAADFAMDHMLLQLRRSPQQEAAVQQFLDSLQDPASPNFHHWLTAEQFGQKFGPAQEDVEAITAWLESHGFTVNVVYRSGMAIDFSGTAAQVREAFHTEIHHLDVNGQPHIANMSDPQIPEALAPAIAGVVSLHDFMPHPMRKAHADYTYTQQGSTYQALVPGDLAAIYNLSPLFKAGVTGAGQTIAVIEDSDLYASSDWSTFRSAFGLSQYSSGSLTTVHPAPSSGTSNCSAPGVLAGDDGEAILDAEWASAAAPDAAIEVASCRNSRTTFGGLIAMENLVNSGKPPALMSVSYGECEAENGASANAAFNSAYQQAAAEGVSVFVAAGDEGGASCDAGATDATHGIGVSAWASTPNNVAVGGSDFADSYNNSSSTYWNSTNASDYSSALSYIPEIPWNDSCASALLSSYLGFAEPYGAQGLCGSTTAQKDQLQEVAAGSGGPSGCASGSPSTSGIVGGTCKGYSKPGWQSGLSGIPNDGVRDIPDVSLFSGTGIWGHYYVTCWTDAKNGGAPCSGAPSGWAGAGGTSFAAPIMAGIQALVNQKAGGAQGNPNSAYYKLAASATCNSSSGDAAGSACVFHNITLGDIAVNCAGAQSCYGAASSTGGGHGGRGGRNGNQGGNGALSLSTQSYDPAFGAAAGWNFATGIGSVNAYNLVMKWDSVK